MNWLAVNGGPLNGGPVLTLVAASATVSGSALVDVSAVRRQEALSTAYVETEITADGQLRKFAGASCTGVADIEAAPTSSLQLLAVVGVAAAFVASSGIIIRPNIGVRGTAELIANASAQQRVFSGQAYGSASCDFDAVPSFTVFAAAKVFDAGAGIQATPTVARCGFSNLRCSATVISTPAWVLGALASSNTFANFVAHPRVELSGSVTGVYCTAESIAIPCATRYGMCVVLAGASFQASGTISDANTIGFDHASRVFYRRATTTNFARRATTTNFVRNAPITEFRRPA